MKSLLDKKMAFEKSENEPTETRNKTTNPKKSRNFFCNDNYNLKLEKIITA